MKYTATKIAKQCCPPLLTQLNKYIQKTKSYRTRGLPFMLFHYTGFPSMMTEGELINEGRIQRTEGGGYYWQEIMLDRELRIQMTEGGD